MKLTLGEKIGANLRKQLEQDRGSSSWLNRGIPFNHGLRLKKEDKEKSKLILQSCEVSQRKENFINLEILIANLLQKGRKRPVIISLNTTDWKLTKYTRAGESTIKIMNNLHDKGYIDLRKGYRTEKESRMSRIWPTDKLLEYFPKFHNAVIYDPVEVVELRDENGNLKEYEDTSKTRHIRSVLERANKVNQSYDIRYKNYLLFASLVAVYKRKFTLYGRLHTRGYRHYQGYSEEERAEITINNNSTVELDFSGLHPHLLYAKEGKQFFGDPYSLVDERPGARPFLKQILLCMLNAKDEITAERAANYWLYRNHSVREDLKEVGITRAKPLITAFRKAHKSIGHYFCIGRETGLRIMNLDAQIALDIVDHFAKQKIPILSIHDSFIVQDKYKNKLRQTMENTYEKHTKGFECKIKQKYSI